MAEEYDRKIAAASDEWSKKSLEREKSAAMQNIEIEALSQSVDWGSVFGNFGTMFRAQLEPTINKLKDISKTEEFRNAELQNQQTLYELISKLEEANTSWDSDIFNKLGNDLTAYQSAMRNYMDAQDKERLATEALADAKKKLVQAEAGGNSFVIAAAKADVLTATAGLTEAADRVRSFGADVHVLKYRQQYLYFYQNVKVRNLNILAYGHNYPLHLFGVRCRRMAVSVSWFKDA